MKAVLKWIVAVVGMSVGGVMAWNLARAGRQRMRQAIGRAEIIADRQRAALAETQGALHDLRESV